MSHFTEATMQLQRAVVINDPASAQLSALVGIGHALLAIAERLPKPTDWHCCECGHSWTERASDLYCPACGSERVERQQYCVCLCKRNNCPHAIKAESAS